MNNAGKSAPGLAYRDGRDSIPGTSPERERDSEAVLRQLNGNAQEALELVKRLSRMRDRLYGDQGQPTENKEPTPLYPAGVVGDMQRLAYETERAHRMAHELLMQIERFA